MWKTIVLLAAVWAVAGVSLAPAAAPTTLPTRDELLVQTQAADVLGQVFTDELSREAPSEKPAFAYRELFDRVAGEVRKGGMDAVDSSLRNLTTSQLLNELMALQSYNQRAFVRLNQVGQSARSPATQPMYRFANDALARVKQRDANPKWDEARRRMRGALNVRAWSTGRAQAPGQVAPQYDLAYSSTPMDDPRWQPYFYGPADELSGWDAAAFGQDPYVFRGGGGVYQRQDTRVNQYFDTRTGGQFDRRVNIDFDRRRNIHVDPRENY
jgi:hypothetical protein